MNKIITFLRTSWIVVVFLASTCFYIIPRTWWIAFVYEYSADARRRYHCWLSGLMSKAMHLLPGVTYEIDNAVGEDLERPAIWICNHTSHLDLPSLLAMTPQLVVLTNDWVWHNPLYRSVIRYAEFLPTALGVDELAPRVRELMRRGYSVIVFPEGTRSADGRIGRFHRGAFHLAERLDVDLLPLYLHGADQVLPPKHFALHPGRIVVEVGRRITPTDDSHGADYRERCTKIRREYMIHLDPSILNGK